MRLPGHIRLRSFHRCESSTAACNMVRTLRATATRIHTEVEYNSDENASSGKRRDDFFRKAIDLGFYGGFVRCRGFLRRRKPQNPPAAHHLHADGQLDKSRKWRADLVYRG